jgi:hypothetical protein
VSVLTKVPSTRNSTRTIDPSASLAVAASETAAPEANDAPLAGLVKATLGAAFVPVPPPLHVVPFKVNDVGAPFAPVNVPLKPAVSVAPLAIALFQSALLATVTTALPAA